MTPRIELEGVLASLFLAFTLSTVVAWVYSFTHTSLSYLRGFTQSLALGGIIAAGVMMAIGDDVARGLGVVGALTIVRFRTTIKDTRDLMFVFASLGTGIAAGVQSYTIAITGTVVFSLAVLFMHWTSFGTHRQFDAVLRLRMPSNGAEQPAFAETIRRYGRRFVLVNLRDVGSDLCEHSYQVEFTNAQARSKLIHAVNALPGASGATLLLQDSSLEL
ncbi:MAG TPA: DUF4956 domain-containing protein [Polyangia bacterium]